MNHWCAYDPEPEIVEADFDISHPILPDADIFIMQDEYEWEPDCDFLCLHGHMDSGDCPECVATVEF